MGAKQSPAQRERAGVREQSLTFTSYKSYPDDLSASLAYGSKLSKSDVKFLKLEELSKEVIFLEVSDALPLLVFSD